MPVMKQNPDGSWSEAEPLGWQEEHIFPVRVIYKLLGLSHCGKKGWRK